MLLGWFIVFFSIIIFLREWFYFLLRLLIRWLLFVRFILCMMLVKFGKFYGTFIYFYVIIDRKYEVICKCRKNCVS